MIILKDFIHLNQEEIKLVLKWRNNESIAKFMKTQNITLKEHLSFLSSLKTNTTKKYFLVYDDKIIIGVINFINITNNSCEFGLYGIKKGVGNLLMQKIKSYAFSVLKIQTLNACVFKENTKALNLYLKHSPIETIKHKKIFYLKYIQKPIIEKLSSINFNWHNELINYEINNKNIIFNFIHNENIILKNFINLNHKEKEKIRLYRNHPEIKKYLYHKHYITKYEHKNFIKKLKQNTLKNYYCVIYNKQILGSINFEIISNDTIEFGFYANPFSKISGLGRILEHISLYYTFKIKKYQNLELEIFNHNIQVINLHKIFKFYTIDKFKFQNETILKMQLKKSDCKTIFQ
ncbi:UDP-4-amino-4,6-dideoxy-N-acetyl-beta-L-altrosamine N-acetyltransferase [Campylobacter lari]|nr:UDP-4-amino-4,6-dideoxy-N-acetyl-beta-L-altrosamine N-acetyltransferase [Campylobacter lari]MCV3493670.1 UDP-4-amino-4,6-dideoxy-N-acetyl-beta-L-altrosamine N-acetyltransferase [Campylobacter lari]MCV3502798.1 UDP-4-amino-4,6-dideoxy-N-acetyl-beta-L-altrosamine N-acetyltransferase [Campylobacter lari]MCV3532616.1 UDP-4-amino-4,6-dideoxy-N-acetyl-beta-L-altrosamine N-acetyltransferase [Campylobacter lari]